MDFASYQCIEFRRSGRILTVLLNRPEQRNAVNARLHRDEIGQAQAFADLDRFLVEADRFSVAAVAPCHSPQVVQGVGGVALVVHGAALGERLRQALRCLLVVVGAPIGHRPACFIYSCSLAHRDCTAARS